MAHSGENRSSHCWCDRKGAEISAPFLILQYEFMNLTVSFLRRIWDTEYIYNRRETEEDLNFIVDIFTPVRRCII